MSSITRRVTACAATLTAALALGAAADAHAAGYYQILNTNTGRALEALVDDKVKLAVPNPANMAQQWKRIGNTTVGGATQAAIDNRLLGCMLTNSPVPNPNLLAELEMGVCNGSSSDSNKRWPFRLTGSPTVPGFQLVNARSGEFIGEEFCWITCGSLPAAILYDAQWVNSDPAQLGGTVTWQFKFVTSAP